MVLKQLKFEKELRFEELKFEKELRFEELKFVLARARIIDSQTVLLEKRKDFLYIFFSNVHFWAERVDHCFQSDNRSVQALLTLIF